MKNINSLPKELAKLKKLTYLRLESISNALNSKSTFELIGQLKSLVELDIQGNGWKTFDGDLMCFINHSTIRIIRLDRNCVFDSYLIRIVNKIPTIKFINEVNC